LHNSGRALAARAPKQPDGEKQMSLEAKMAMTEAQLRELYSNLPKSTAKIAQGRYRGLVAVKPGTTLGKIPTRIFNALWKGKEILPGQGSLVNLTVFGRIIKAKVELSKSVIDGGDCIAFIYATMAARHIRDEVRYDPSDGVWVGPMVIVNEKDGSVSNPVLYFGLASEEEKTAN
jgi:hypothetical protein